MERHILYVTHHISQYKIDSSSLGFRSAVSYPPLGFYSSTLLRFRFPLHCPDGEVPPLVHTHWIPDNGLVGNDDTRRQSIFKLETRPK